MFYHRPNDPQPELPIDPPRSWDVRDYDPEDDEDHDLGQAGNWPWDEEAADEWEDEGDWDEEDDHNNSQED